MKSRSKPSTAVNSPSFPEPTDKKTMSSNKKMSRDYTGPSPDATSQFYTHGSSNKVALKEKLNNIELDRFVNQVD